ncbi:MAG TPA: sigma-70 family RNA polymerase sigma factor [Aliidongia sp.]|nr:sigma-70 family RNA polymerase sigma factor [Aliidongia sp.]
MEPAEDWSSLMARAQNGDQRAYGDLLTGITPYLRALARRALFDPRDSEEAVQDVLLTIHQIRHTYDPARPFTPWLATIAQRRIVDRVRINAQHARRKLAVAEQLLVEPAGRQEDPEPDEYDALRAAIHLLPEGQRQAVELLKLRELSLKEASSLSGISAGALKVAVHRALKSLRRRLDEKAGS